METLILNKAVYSCVITNNGGYLSTNGTGIGNRGMIFIYENIS